MVSQFYITFNVGNLVIEFPPAGGLLDEGLALLTLLFFYVSPADLLGTNTHTN
jgi:hypothetical protein